MTTLLNRPTVVPFELLQGLSDRLGWHTQESFLDTYPELTPYWDLIEERINTSSIYFYANESLLISKRDSELLLTKIKVSRSKVPFLTPCEIPYKIQLLDAQKDLIVKEGVLKSIIGIRKENLAPTPYEEILQHKGYMYVCSRKQGNLIFTKAGVSFKGIPMYRVRKVIVTPSGYLTFIRPTIDLSPNE